MDDQPAADDRTQITDVVYQYTWRIDYSPRDDFSSVFTDDVTFELTNLGVRFQGREAVTKMIKEALELTDYCKYYVSNTQVRIQGDKAMSRCYLSAAAGKQGTAGHDMRTEGRYFDQFVRTSGGWRISKRSYRETIAGGTREINVE